VKAVQRRLCRLSVSRAPEGERYNVGLWTGRAMTMSVGGRGVLDVAGLSLGFRTKAGRTEVLSDLSLSMAAGTWTTCLGPSGCGKTTLLRVLAGLLAPDRGTIRLGGSDAPRSRATAYLPQQETLLPWRRALANAVLASEILRRPRADALREARALFARFGLSGAEELYPWELSGGMRQRVAIIRTYLAHRDVLLLDEPLGALDPLTRTTLQGWLLDVWRELGKTVLLVTHDVEEALLLSDRVLVLTPRPARVRRAIEASLPRPRSRTAPEFVREKEELLLLLTEGTG
jgi:putative hydroxymethylpyrimidine transport system ATP-binding protein